MWQELGIAATTDIKAIRRAYAGRLRRIDVDRDPAAFKRLRQAFEAALGPDHPGGIIRWWLAPSDRYEPWLGDRLDRRRLARLARRCNRSGGSGSPRRGGG